MESVVITITVPGALTILTLAASFIIYVGRAENRLGKFEERVGNMKQQLDRMEGAINKLFDRDYERTQKDS